MLDNWIFTTWMTLLTIYALFGDDIRLLATDKSSDPVFFSLSIVCLFFFLIEVILGSLVKENYFLGFFFYLDVVATLSLIPDIGWLWDPIVGNEDSGNDAAQASQIARAGRASRAGTRAGRVIRILRVIRLIRIVKLYKLTQEAKEGMQTHEQSKLQRANVIFRGDDHPVADLDVLAQPPLRAVEDAQASQSFDSIDIQNPENMMFTRRVSKQDFQTSKLDDEKNLQVPEESKVGKRLSELTTRRVIMLVLGMMFGLPLFNTSMHMNQNTSYQFGLEVLNSFVHDPVEFEFTWNHYIDNHEDLDTPLIYLEVGHDDLWIWEDGPHTDDLRTTEKEVIVLINADDDYKYASVAIFDLRSDSQLQAGLNMARTVFICVVLALSSVLFSKDANDLLLGPIEDMIEKVKKIQLNPLEAAANEEREAVTRELALQENPDLASTQTKKKGGEGPMETVILEQTIIKIGALLALGFGEAGSEIIATNMRRAGGEVDPMIPGKKTYCIFGFCDIRQFTDTTEVLQEKVMVFVNRIAEVVHTIVDQYSGNANKNIGDAFLLVWKYPEEVLQYNTTHSSPGRNHPFMENLADMSLISFLKIQAAINTNPKIIKYRNNTKLQAGVPGFSVKMGFGLHFGWAIEGAIGSEFKIDASYLSPNVNMASRLEAATKQYGVPLLVSGQLYNILSYDVKQNLRLLDVVKVKGSEQDTRLYTCDIDPTVLQPTTNSISEYKDKKHKRVLQRIARDELRHKAYLGTFKISTLFQEDEELKLMRSTISAAFISKFSQGVEAYVQGDWEHAKTILIEVNEMKPDGPTNTLLEVIEEFGGRAPPDWKGSRYLTEK